MQNSRLPILKHINNFLDYTDIEKGLSKKTQENYGRFLNRFVRWLDKNKLNSLLPHELTAEIVWQYRIFLSRQTLSEQTKEELSKATQNYYLIALRALLDYFTEKDINSLPASKIKLAKQPKNRSVHFLTFEKVKKLLDSAATNDLAGLRDKAIMETLFSTGLRVSELVRLNRDQINVKNTQTVFELAVTGKGNKSRLVYFSPRCLHWLKKYLEKRLDVEKSLFVNFKNNKNKNESRRLSVRSIERIIKKYTKIAGLPLATTPHTLRHSFATDLLTQGVDLRLIQEFLGHEDISTTQIYTHVTNKNLRDIYSKFHGGGKANENSNI